MLRARNIGLGEAHAGKEVRLVVADARPRVVAARGSLLANTSSTAIAIISIGGD